MRHFLGRLCQAMFRFKSSGWTCLRPSEKSDLHLFSTFLEYALEGISLNTIVFRHPTHVYRSDASEFGLGGYNIVTGKAWRFEIPIDYRLKTTLNALEFIACMINIWIDVLSDEIDSESCLLSQTDSTTAAGWLRKSNFADAEDEVVQMTTARHLASLTIQTKSCLYSQWFSGGENVVSDALSRDFHLSSNDLSLLIKSSVPEQVSFGLEIHHLPNEISSWLICLLQNQPSTKQWSKEPTRSKIALGLDTNITSVPLDANKIYSLNPLQEPNIITSSQHLLTQSEKVDIAIKITQDSNQNQSEPPWIAWHRPLSWLTSPTQDWTERINLQLFYSANSEATQTLTNPLPPRQL
jgi:hypothetical protein